jgi:hypothetical protein
MLSILKKENIKKINVKKIVFYNFEALHAYITRRSFLNNKFK